MTYLLLQTNAQAQSPSSKGSEQYFDQGVLVSVREPALAIDVVDSFTFIGRHPIRIRDVAAGERFVFVDAADRAIQRLLIVQFEGFLLGIDDFYRYDLSGHPVIAGHPFRSNAYAFDILDAIAANPDSESAATYPYLTSRGYSGPRHWMQWRSLTVTDKARKKEMIIFYVEDIDATGLTLAGLYEDDASTACWINIQKDLEKRANGSFRLTRLDQNNAPIESAWSSIPNN